MGKSKILDLVENSGMDKLDDIQKINLEEVRTKLGIYISADLAKQIDIKLFLSIVKLTQFAVESEQRNLSADLKTQTAMLNAAKLVLLFKTRQGIIDYLERYLKQYPDSKKLIHDACLFSLPDEPNWNIHLWQDIIEQQKPSRPKDMILRIIPLATQIEKYVNDNKTSLTAQLRQDILSGHELELSNEYDEISALNEDSNYTTWIDKRLATKSKLIQRETEQAINNYLLKSLGFPIRKALTQPQRDAINQRKENLSRHDLEEIYEIKQEIYYKHRQEIIENIQKDNAKIKNIEKKSYIEEKLKQATRKGGVIDAKVKDQENRILSKTTPLAVLAHYASRNFYKRANENEYAAKLFFEMGLTESQFNSYLALTPVDSPAIPYVYINGSDIDPSYSKYFLKKSDPSDPRAAYLGKLTSCCQTIGDVGNDAVVHGITQPDGGFYVLCRREFTAEGEEKEKIVSQCWAYKTPEGVLKICRDSVESQIDFAKNNNTLINDFFVLLDEKLRTEHKVQKITVGESGQTPEEQGLFRPIVPLYPKYSGYRDSYSQRLMVDGKLPLWFYYLRQNPQSKLKFEHFSIEALTKEEINPWVDLCFANKYRYLINNIFEFMSSDDAADDAIRELVARRVQFNEDWINFINDWYLANTPKLKKELLARTEEFIHLGVNINLFEFPYYTDEKITYSPLYLAIQHNNIDLVKLLLRHGAEPRIDNSFEYVINEKHFEIADQIIAACPQIILLFPKLLLHTVTTYNVQGVEYLLRNGFTLPTDNKTIEKYINFILKFGESDYYNTDNIFNVHPVDDDEEESPEILNRRMQERDKDIADKNRCRFEILKLLINAGLDVKSLNSRSVTPLDFARRYSDIEFEKKLLAAGAVEKYEIIGERLREHRNENKQEPTSAEILADDLCVALTSSVIQIEAIEKLIAAGANINTITTSWGHDFIPLSIVLHSSEPNLNVLTLLLEKGADPAIDPYLFQDIFDLFLKNPNETTLNILKLSIKNGANPHSLRQGLHALLSASNPNDSIVNAFKLFLDSGLDVMTIDSSYQTVIQLANQSNKSDFFRLIFEAGEARSDKKIYDACLRVAATSEIAASNQFENLNLLESLGANLATPAEEDDMSLLSYAVFKNNVPLATFLLKKNLDPNVVEPSERRPIHYVKSVEMLKLLIAADADINKTAFDDFTVLFFVDDLATFIALLKAGANVNAQTTMGETALFQAVRFNEKEKIIALLENGADIGIKNSAGESVFDLECDEDTKDLLDKYKKENKMLFAEGRLFSAKSADLSDIKANPTLSNDSKDPGTPSPKAPRGKD